MATNVRNLKDKLLCTQGVLPLPAQPLILSRYSFGRTERHREQESTRGSEVHARTAQVQKGVDVAINKSTFILHNRVTIQIL